MADRHPTPGRPAAGDQPEPDTKEQHMGQRTETAKKVTTALRDLWTAQTNQDQSAQQAAIARGHDALRGTGQRQ